MTLVGEDMTVAICVVVTLRGSAFPPPGPWKSVTEEEVLGPEEEPEEMTEPDFLVFWLATWETKSVQTMPLNLESFGSEKSQGWIKFMTSSSVPE